MKTEYKKRVENWLDSLQEKKEQEIQLQKHREKQYEEMMKGDMVPLVIRVDRSTMSTMHFDNEKQDKTEKLVSIQFLPHLYARDELRELEDWIGKGNVKMIQISKETFMQVSESSRKEKFTICYDEKGWNGIAMRCLDEKMRNELLRTAMSVIEGRSFKETV